MKNTITDIQKSHRPETIRGLSAMSTCVRLAPYRLQKKRLHASRACGRNFPKTLKLSQFLLSWSKDARIVVWQTTLAAESTLCLHIKNIQTISHGICAIYKHSTHNLVNQ